MRWVQRSHSFYCLFSCGTQLCRPQVQITYDLFQYLRFHLHYAWFLFDARLYFLAIASWPPKILIPNRLLADSRPFFELPTPFL